MDQQRSAFILPSSLWCCFLPFLPSLVFCRSFALPHHRYRIFFSSSQPSGFPRWDEGLGKRCPAGGEGGETSQLSSSPSFPSAPVIIRPLCWVYFLWSLTHTTSRCWDWNWPLLPFFFSPHSAFPCAYSAESTPSPTCCSKDFQKGKWHLLAGGRKTRDFQLGSSLRAMPWQGAHKHFRCEAQSHRAKRQKNASLWSHSEAAPARNGCSQYTVTLQSCQGMRYWNKIPLAGCKSSQILHWGSRSAAWRKGASLEDSMCVSKWQMMGREINYLAVCLSLCECCWLPCMDFRDHLHCEFLLPTPTACRSYKCINKSIGLLAPEVIAGFAGPTGPVFAV